MNKNPIEISITLLPSEVIHIILHKLKPGDYMSCYKASKIFHVMTNKEHKTRQFFNKPLEIAVMLNDLALFKHIYQYRSKDTVDEFKTYDTSKIHYYDTESKQYIHDPDYCSNATHICADKYALMNIACSNGYLDFVEYLHDLGKPINIDTFEYACGGGNYDVIAFLLSVDCPYDESPGYYDNCDHLETVVFCENISEQECLKIVKLLWETGIRGRDRSEIGNPDSWTSILQTAIDENRYEIVKYLIYNGCDKDIQYCNPIVIASQHDDLPFIKHLRSLKYKCKPVSFTFAVQNKNKDILDYFLTDCFIELSKNDPMAHAAWLGDIDLFNQFISYGFEITAWTLLCAIDCTWDKRNKNANMIDHIVKLAFDKLVKMDPIKLVCQYNYHYAREYIRLIQQMGKIGFKCTHDAYKIAERKSIKDHDKLMTCLNKLL